MILEHPEIAWIERTGYPSWMQPKEDEDDGSVLPELARFEMGDGGNAILSVEGFGEEYFAVGAELFVVGLGGGEKMTVVGVVPLLGDGKIELEVAFENLDWITVVITPIAYSRLGCARGEKSVVVGWGEIAV